MAEQQVEEANTRVREIPRIGPQRDGIYLPAWINSHAAGSRPRSKRRLQQGPRARGMVEHLTEIGVLAYHGSKCEEARTDLERAIESAPSYQKAHYYYALTLSRLGRKTEADREFTIAKGLQKEHGAELHLAATQP